MNIFLCSSKFDFHSYEPW